jgi:hypothetical protein
MKKFEAIRQAIKTLSEDQKKYKPLRKPSNIKADDPDSPEWYQQAVRSNKYELRHLFQAYSVLKGKQRQETKRKEISESYVTKLVQQYGDNL